MAKFGGGGFQGGGGNNMNSLLKQVQKAQKQMEEKQKELEVKEYEASAGGNAVKAVVTGKRELISIALDQSVVDPDDIEMLQDLIVLAVNNAIKQADDESAKLMGELTGGMNLPGMF
ncbi:MAG: YbaB/EbfC family nucleoid-associated protein [Clostridiaceae bacterium]